LTRSDSEDVYNVISVSNKCCTFGLSMHPTQLFTLW